MSSSPAAPRTVSLPEPPRKGVPAIATIDVVVAGITEHGVIAEAAVQLVVPAVRGRVVAAALKPVIAAPAVEQVVAGAAAQDVGATLPVSVSAWAPPVRFSTETSVSVPWLPELVLVLRLTVTPPVASE